MRTKLRLGGIADPAEREADRVAEAITRGTRHVGAIASVPRQVSCACGICDSCRTVRRKAAEPRADATGEVPDHVAATVGISGVALPDVLRRFFEPRFGRSLAHVRLHADSAAARSAEAIGAEAYTLGHDIVFAHGAYRPESAAGRALIAHELTHTVQQDAADGIVRRRPDLNSPALWEPVTLPKSAFGGTPFFTGPKPSADDADPLFFAGYAHRRVTQANLVGWAFERMRSRDAVYRRVILSMLQRRRDDDLRKLWAHEFDDRLRELAASHGFVGSDAAQQRFQGLLRPHGDDLVADAMQRSEDTLIQTVLDAVHSGKVPAGAGLETDKVRIARIEDAPEHEPTPLGYGLGPRQRTIKAGDEWPGRHIVSSNRYGLVMEVEGQEGIYFSVGTTDLVRENALVAVVGAIVARRTAALDVFSKFLKGFASAVAALPIALVDAGAKLIDMQTMLVASIGKMTGWYESGYTCLSSTCRTYDECTETKTPEVCKSEVLDQALEDAVSAIPIVNYIPIIHQIRQCYHGDAEACGGIAFLAASHAYGSLEKLAPKLEEAGVRSIYGRARPEDTVLNEEAEKARLREERLAGRGGSGDGAAGRTGRIRAFAERVRARLRGGAAVTPEVIEREVVQVERNAADPTRVRRPIDPAFDAEVPAGDNRITYRREKGSEVWDRCWNPCVGDAPVEPATGAVAERTLEKADRAAAKEALDEVRKTDPSESDAVAAKTLRQQLRAKLEAKVAEAKAAIDNVQRAKDRVDRRVGAINNELRRTSDPALRTKLRAQRKALLDFREAVSGKDLGINWQNAYDVLKATEQDYFYALSDAARSRPAYKAVAAKLADEVFGTTGRELEVEHVYPRSAIFRTPGFERLSWDQQVALFNLDGNLKLIPGDINLARSNIPYAELTSQLSRFPEATPERIAGLAAIERAMKTRIDGMIRNPSTIP